MAHLSFLSKHYNPFWFHITLLIPPIFDLIGSKLIESSKAQSSPNGLTIGDPWDVVILVPFPTDSHFFRINALLQNGDPDIDLSSEAIWDSIRNQPLPGSTMLVEEVVRHSVLYDNVTPFFLLSRIYEEIDGITYPLNQMSIDFPIPNKGLAALLRLKLDQADLSESFEIICDDINHGHLFVRTSLKLTNPIKYSKP